MITVGAACLILALGVAVYGAVAALAGTRGDRRFTDSARRAVYAFAALLTICVVVIEAAFARTDLSLQVVADHSSTTTPGFYKLTAMWSSQEGSLLLWAWVLSLTSSAVLFATRNKHREIAPWATAVLMGLGVFFTGLMLLEANPFARLDPVPAEGVGLTPLLRHPAMAIHPPMLYSGYVFLSIPFAFAIGALITRRLDASWIRATRRFALIAWLFLGIGILLGARWSYSELGWGGYWGWDPVENASLMPWLTATAFLHSVMVQERRGMLKVWNVTLICGTFALALLGTFLVRSGILQSIHAFGASTVGGPLLGLIAIVVIGSALLIVSRLDDLRSTKRIESLASREAVFLVNNLLLVGAGGGDLLGHLLPADLRALHRRQGFARRTVVQPLHDAAGDPAGAVHGDRPPAGLAPGQRRRPEAAAGPPRPGRAGERGGAVRPHRRALGAPGADPVLARRLLADGPGYRSSGAAQPPTGRWSAAPTRGRYWRCSLVIAVATAATSSTRDSPSC